MKFSSVSRLRALRLHRQIVHSMQIRHSKQAPTPITIHVASGRMADDRNTDALATSTDELVVMPTLCTLAEDDDVVIAFNAVVTATNASLGVTDFPISVFVVACVRAPSAELIKVVGGIAAPSFNSVGDGTVVGTRSVDGVAVSCCCGVVVIDVEDVVAVDAFVVVAVVLRLLVDAAVVSFVVGVDVAVVVVTGAVVFDNVDVVVDVAVDVVAVVVVVTGSPAQSTDTKPGAHAPLLPTRHTDTAVFPISAHETHPAAKQVAQSLGLIPTHAAELVGGALHSANGPDMSILNTVPAALVATRTYFSCVNAI
jgi:hypothetical protein